MKLGIAGLGRMGANMARRLRQGGIEVAAWNRSPEVTQALASECGVVATSNLTELIDTLPSPRIVWLMLPAGDVTQRAIDEALPLLDAGDVLVDGANSFYKDSVRRAAAVERGGVHYVDAGVSGGIWGRDNGYALMVGGSQDAVAMSFCEPRSCRGLLSS